MKIEGYFSGFKNANEAANRLKAEGMSKAYVDLNEHYQINTDARTKEVAFLPTSSNSDLVLNSGTPSGSTGKSPLLAASPMVSGLGNFEEIADVNYKIIVEGEEKDKVKIQQVIKDMGGSIQSPDINLPERIENVDLGKIDPDFPSEL